MNSVHDMGGMQAFGPVRPEADEPVFHAAWEKRALALTLAMGATGQWNIDLSRSARESLPPALYLGSSYYQIWLNALENLMRERGLASGRGLLTVTDRLLDTAWDCSENRPGAPHCAFADQEGQIYTTTLAGSPAPLLIAPSLPVTRC